MPKFGDSISLTTTRITVFVVAQGRLELAGRYGVVLDSKHVWPGFRAMLVSRITSHKSHRESCAVIAAPLLLRGASCWEEVSSVVRTDDDSAEVFLLGGARAFSKTGSEAAQLQKMPTIMI